MTQIRLSIWHLQEELDDQHHGSGATVFGVGICLKRVNTLGLLSLNVCTVCESLKNLVRAGVARLRGALVSSWRI
jgi:hypothetical protein